MDAIRCFSILMLSIVGHGLVAADQNVLPLANLSYRELCRQIHRPPEMVELQKRLNISSQQIKSIQLLESKYRTKYEKATVFHSSEVWKVDAASILEVEKYRKQDDEVREDLAAILNERQIKDFRRCAMSIKFRNGCDPFRNWEVLSHCRLLGADMSSLTESAERAAIEFVTVQKKLQFQTARTIVGALNVQSQTLFAQYAGNKYSPGITVEPFVEFDSVPFPHSVKSYSTLVMLMPGSGGATWVGLTDPQKEQLLEIDIKYLDMCRSGLSESIPTFDALDKVATNYCVDALQKTLSPEQFNSIARYQALHQFEANPFRTFSDPRFLPYLQITGEEAKTVKEVVSTEWHNLQASVAELNRRLFFELCSKLPREANERMQLTFNGVWDL